MLVYIEDGKPFKKAEKENKETKYHEMYSLLD